MEKLKLEETRKFIVNAFRDGTIETTGTEIDRLMPPVLRFGGGGRVKKKKERHVMGNKDIVRRHYWFSGCVQGVGFRYHAYYIAKSLGLTGWVQNSWDERVEMEVQGRREDISLMLVRLNNQMRISIEGIEEETIPVVEEDWFHIKN